MSNNAHVRFFVYPVHCFADIPGLACAQLWELVCVAVCFTGQVPFLLSSVQSLNPHNPAR